MQEFCSNLILCASAIKTELKAVKQDCSASLAWRMPSWGTVPLTHLAPGNVTLGQVTTAKALTAPFSSGQAYSCRTMDSPEESRASFFCFLYQMSRRIRFKTWTSVRTFWIFSHFYKSSKSRQVAHVWFQGSATCWSTSAFFLPWLQVENTWINWIPVIAMPIKAFDRILNDSISPPQIKPSLNTGNVQP